MKMSASAPGKLLLLGDHAVVYGRPCLVTAVDLRYRATVETLPGDTVEILTPQLDAPRRVIATAVGSSAPRETAFVEAAVARVFERAGQQTGLRVTTAGPPLSYGLGSSSAITVATVAALAALLDLDLTRAEQFALAYDAVLAVQGTGSGFDLAAALYGGTLYFVTGGKMIEPLTVPHLPLVIGYSGSKVGTVNLVAEVARRREQRPAVIDGIFDVMRHLVEDGRQQLVAGDWSAFGELMNLNQGLLDALGVNTPSLTRLIESARAAGAAGAKLSGAGGGDCMYAVHSGKVDTIAAAISAAGGDVVAVPVHAPGVRLEDAI